MHMRYFMLIHLSHALFFRQFLMLKKRTCSQYAALQSEALQRMQHVLISFARFAVPVIEHTSTHFLGHCLGPTPSITLGIGLGPMPSCFPFFI